MVQIASHKYDEQGRKEIWGGLSTKNDSEYDRRLLLETAKIAFDAEEEHLRLEAEKRREQGSENRVPRTLKE